MIRKNLHSESFFFYCIQWFFIEFQFHVHYSSLLSLIRYILLLLYCRVTSLFLFYLDRVVKIINSNKFTKNVVNIEQLNNFYLLFVIFSQKEIEILVIYLTITSNYLYKLIINLPTFNSSFFNTYMTNQ